MTRRCCLESWLELGNNFSNLASDLDQVLLEKVFIGRRISHAMMGNNQIDHVRV